MPNSQIAVIAIDGPTASGKGTVAHKVADRLGFHYLDSGALYRLTALMALRRGNTIRINDPKCVAKTFPDYFEAFAGIAHEDLF